MAFITLALAGCPGDDGGDSGATATPTGNDGSSTSNDSDDTESPTTAVSETMSSDPGTTTSGGSTTTDDTAASSSSGAEGGSSSTGNPNACDPQIPGEWNACIAEDGDVDTTLCNWMGLPDATGFIGCLNSSDMDGANSCIITGCEDVCDCFAAPATGDAPVTCGDILADGGTACYLDCSNGEACPDGMMCLGNACFFPPAE